MHKKRETEHAQQKEFKNEGERERTGKKDSQKRRKTQKRERQSHFVHNRVNAGENAEKRHAKKENGQQTKKEKAKEGREKKSKLQEQQRKEREREREMHSNAQCENTNQSPCREFPREESCSRKPSLLLSLANTTTHGLLSFPEKKTSESSVVLPN